MWVVVLTVKKINLFIPSNSLFTKAVFRIRTTFDRIRIRLKGLDPEAAPYLAPDP